MKQIRKKGFMRNPLRQIETNGQTIEIRANDLVSLDSVMKVMPTMFAQLVSCADSALEVATADRAAIANDIGLEAQAESGQGDHPSYNTLSPQMM